MIGWRLHEDRIDDPAAHFYSEEETTGGDSISLCRAFRYWQEHLVFPRPGMHCCSYCKMKAEVLYGIQVTP